MKAHTPEKAEERQRAAAGRDLLPLLADSFLADLLPAAGGREAEGDIEQKFNLLIHSSWHSSSGRREVFSCEVAMGKGATGVLKLQRSAGFGGICPGPGAGQRLADPLIGALEANLPRTCSGISVEGRAHAEPLLERFHSAQCLPFAGSRTV